MTIALDHMSVPTRDKVRSAEFYADLFGVSYEGPRRDYAPIIVNDGLGLNFEDREVIDERHYAFRMSADEFQRVLARLAVAGIPHGDSTRTSDGSIYERGGVRGFFFKDLDGHSVECITKQ